MTCGLAAALICAVWLLPPHVSFDGALNLAAAAGRLNVITTTFDWNDRYNLWSGLIGGAFLALAYFGTDQSQVQRYLSGQSVRDSRRGLMLNAVAKIPMQLCILFIGAIVFVFYIYERPPVLFQQLDRARIEAPDLAARYAPIKQRYDTALATRRSAADQLLQEPANVAATAQRQSVTDDFRRAERDVEAARKEAAALAASTGGSGASDTNYIFLTFVTQHLPVGAVGLILAVVFGATMTAISAEMSSLATVTVLDVYKRHVHPAATDRHYLMASRLATVFWGIYAFGCAQLVKGLGSLIEVVNILGSLFYGGMLGVFVLAFFVKRATARAAFWAVLVRRRRHFLVLVFHQHRLSLVQRHRLRRCGRMRNRVLRASDSSRRSRRRRIGRFVGSSPGRLALRKAPHGCSPRPQLLDDTSARSPSRRCCARSGSRTRRRST